MPYEYQVDVGGVIYGMKDIMSAEIVRPLFDKLSVGNACSAEFDMSFWPKTNPPRMAKIVPYVREVGSSTWTNLGVFYIDERQSTGTLMDITAFDVMLKAETVWVPSNSLVFPMTMQRAATLIAGYMGTSLDARCSISTSYTIDYPANDYTYRDVLCDIAAAHAGNWVATGDGKLLLVPLFSSMPQETNYLVTETGNAITFGGTRIIV